MQIPLICLVHTETCSTRKRIIQNSPHGVYKTVFMGYTKQSSWVLRHCGQHNSVRISNMEFWPCHPHACVRVGYYIIPPFSSRGIWGIWAHPSRGIWGIWAHPSRGIWGIWAHSSQGIWGIWGIWVLGPTPQGYFGFLAHPYGYMGALGTSLELLRGLDSLLSRHLVAWSHCSTAMLGLLGAPRCYNQTECAKITRNSIASTKIFRSKW